ERSMIEVDVGLRHVHARGREVADVLLDDPVDLHVRDRVEPHVREVEVDVVGDPEFGGGGSGLFLLLRPQLRVAGVLRRAAVGHTDDADAVAAIGVDGDRPTHPQHLVVRVRGEDEDAVAHPSLAPTESVPETTSTSSRSKPPSPQATTGPSGSSETIVPAGTVSSS